MTKLLVSSDLHGRVFPVMLQAVELNVDVWVDCGDFYPDRYYNDVGFSKKRNTEYQRAFINSNSNAKELQELRSSGIPCTGVMGNHDWFSQGHLICQGWAGDLHLKTLTIKGVKFAGLSSTMFISNEFNYGVKDNSVWDEQLKQLLAAEADVIVMHSPPEGILNEAEYGGVPMMANMLSYGSYKPKLVVFGHHHRTDGHTEIEGVRYVNTAQTSQVIEL